MGKKLLDFYSQKKNMGAMICFCQSIIMPRQITFVTITSHAALATQFDMSFLDVFFQETSAFKNYYPLHVVNGRAMQ